MPPEPRVLAFDTSAAHCAAALLSGDRIVASRSEAMAKGQAERLFPLLDEVLGAAGLTYADLSALGVGIGPGNFTGIRISVAAARGLAMALEIPAVGVSTLEAQAEGLARPVLSVKDARRGRAYAQSFADGTSLPAQLVEIPDLDGLAGPGIAVVGEPLPDAPLTPMPPPVPVAEAIARLAAERFSTVSAPPSPLYIRPADAAPPREAPPVLLP